MEGIKNTKRFEDTFAWINELVSAKIITTHDHPFIPKDCPIKKEKRRFELSYTATGIDQAIGEAFEKGIRPFEFHIWDKKYCTADDGCRITHCRRSIIPDISDCILSMVDFHSADFDANEVRWYRYITKIDKGEDPKMFHRVQTMGYITGKVTIPFQLIALALPEGEVQVGYVTAEKNGDRYFFIEPRFECSAKYLLDISFPITTALGFLVGNVHLNDCFVFKYEDDMMAEPIGMEYKSRSESYSYQYHIFADNPFPYVDCALKRMNTFKSRDEYHQALTTEAGKYQGLVSSEVLSNLVNLFIANDSLLRAAHTMMVSGQSTLESQPATCAVALETITSFVTNTNNLKAANVVRDGVWAETSKAFNDFIDHKLSKGDLTQKEHDFIAKKLKYINQPTNKDKLSLPFSHVGYNLREDEVKAIKNRNTLLHGSIGIDLEDMKKASDKLLHDTFILHRLCGILLLKLAGYSGPIINYAKAYGLDKSKGVNDVFIEI